MIDFLKRQRMWVAQYIGAILVTILLFAGMRACWVAPLQEQCTDAGGRVVHDVRNFLCVDAEGHVILVQH